MLGEEHLVGPCGFVEYAADRSGGVLRIVLAGARVHDDDKGCGRAHTLAGLMKDTIGTEQDSGRRSLRTVVAASLVGTAIEWYDFFLYGTAAAIVFPALFFPQSEP